ncbi:hypothetical protein [Streptomyces sp. BK205]|uniref:hypothetical protein n=1 Tax=Streptomyces sp. BK205 TaxID=2512164 RepID=UPI00104F0396|nr:hypothetical protein [Streptomyces sp. BK205]TCR20923.1 hypothetical protein EV578_10658 [Streptomyces sp. BK205]
MPSAARTLPLALSLPLLLLLGPVPAARAADGWSLAPAGGGRPAFYAEGAPGTVVQDTVSVTNRGSRPVTVRLSGATFARGSVRVPARTRADVPFTVTVPDRDRGTRILARDDTGGTRSLPVHLRSTAPELSALTVEHVTVHANRITYDVVNRGTTPLTPRVAVRADGVLGPLLDLPPRTLPVPLPPGARLHLTEPWPDPPALDAVDVRLTVTAAGGAHDTAGASARFVPWRGVAGTAAALAAGGACWVVRRRRRRTAGRAPSEAPRTEAELTGATT